MVLIENGEIFSPTPRGKASVLLAGGSILHVGKIEGKLLAQAGAEVETLDAKGCLVMPGLIDPHQHVTGGSGEEGYSSQSPPLTFAEIALSGVSTVVGTLGVDARMKTMPDLLGRIKALKEAGFSAYAFSGGYAVPPTTLLGDIRDDILFIEEIIGAGEIAIADYRSTDPAKRSLAKVISACYVAGTLSSKAGVVHFHVGETDQRLKLLRSVLNEFDIKPETLYPTHLERSEKLMLEGMELVKRGSFMDLDTTESDLKKWLKFYLDHQGDLERLTLSSDADSSSPQTRFAQIKKCIQDKVLPLEKMLPLVTTNIAKILKFQSKGTLAPGMDADVLILEKNTLDLCHLFSKGNRMVADGEVLAKERYLKNIDRHFETMPGKIEVKRK